MTRFSFKNWNWIIDWFLVSHQSGIIRHLTSLQGINVSQVLAILNFVIQKLDLRSKNNSQLIHVCDNAMFDIALSQYKKPKYFFPKMSFFLKIVFLPQNYLLFQNIINVFIFSHDVAWKMLQIRRSDLKIRIFVRDFPD